MSARRRGPDAPQAICFDLDDTLIACDSVRDLAWDEACMESAREIGSDRIERLHAMLGEVAAWYWKDPERHLRGRMNITLARREIVSETLHRIGIEDEDLSLRMANRYCVLHYSKVKLLPGAIETLEWLRAESVRLCLITNGASSTQREKIARFNLAPLFDEIVVEEEVGIGKPDPAIFSAALERLRTGPARAWMVGDNLEKDIRGGQGSGLFAIWHDWRRAGLPPDAPAIPDHVITGVGQLLPLIASSAIVQ